MSNEKHLLLSIIGDWNDSALAAESWQVGIRLALVFNGDVDPVATLPNNWSPVATSINRTETDWTITGNWKVTFGSANFNPDDYLNDQVAPAVTTWAARTATSSKCRVRALKVSPIVAPHGTLEPAPPYAKGSPCLLEWTGAYPVGGNVAELLPLQNAAVASHRTPQTGRAGRGRAFLPGLTAGAMDGHGHLSSTVTAGLLDAQVTLLEALAYNEGGIDTYAIRPIVTGGNFTKYGLITTVKVGNVMDTQRRRRRSLEETYATGSVSY